MRTFSIFTISLLFLTSLLAQTPGINYQAIVRDADGLPMANQNVSLSIDILESDLLLFTEVHEVVTDEFGLINTIIGSGVAEFGTLDNLIGKKDLSYTLTAIINGTETSLGTGKLGAVPYAYYGADEDADPENEMQDLQIDGSSLSLSSSDIKVDLDEFATPWQLDSLGYFLEFDIDSSTLSRSNASRSRLGVGGQILLGENPDVFSLPKQLVNLNLLMQSEKGVSIKTLDASDDKFKTSDFNVTADGNEILTSSIVLNTNNISAQTGFNLLASDFKLEKTQEFTTGENLKWSSGLTNFSPTIPLGVQTTSMNVVDNEEDLTPNSMLFQSNGEIEYDYEFLNNFEIEPFHKVEIVPGLFIISQLIKEDETIKNESRLSPDGEVVCSREESFNADGSISSSCSSLDHTNCVEISETGNFSNKVTQDGETRINEGIDGSTMFSEMIGGDNTTSLGGIIVKDDSGVFAAVTAVTSADAAILNSAGGSPPSPGLNVRSMTAFPNTQHFTEGGLELSLGVNSEFAGNISVLNDGVRNLNLGTLQGIPNAGSIVGFDEGAPKWYLYTQDGVSQLLIDMVQTTVLSPNHDEEMAYGVLAGPEQAAYERGTATLVDGEVFVSCADHFAGIADPNSMTVTITPLSAESLGLAIVEKSAGGFKVKELYNGKGNYSFDYMVMCKRSDVAYELKPELPKADNSMKEISDQARTNYLKAKSTIK